MEFNEVVANRREITSFLTKPIPYDVLERILSSAYLAPTGNNLPSREFIVVNDKEMLQTLSKTTPYVSWLNEASFAIVITGRPDVSKYWIQDSSIASSFIWLSAVNEGIGCAFGAVLNTTDEKESEQRETYVKEALAIPSNRRVLAILGLGYPNEKPKEKVLPEMSEIIYYGKFGENEI
ncbi:nitroreductase family protein [Virgibacillus sp. 6R]|uniref:nitroreductase family protein n=1 Tax=Metabacillus sp. 22489 TaxID=3453928 RepID=UPI0011AA4304